MGRGSVYSILFGAFMLALISAHNACNGSQGFSAAGGSALTSNSVPDPTPIVAAGPKTFSVQLNSMNNISINLDEMQQVDVTVTSQNGFVGSINIALDRTKLATLDPNGDINISPSQIPLDLLAGESKKVTLNITTKSTSLAGAGVFSLVASPVSTGYQGTVQLDFNLGVNPVYQVFVLGLVNNVMIYNRPTTLTNFRKQSVPLIVRYLNADTLLQHIIHGSGLIIHQNVDTPLVVANSAGPVPGGIYEVKIMPSNTPANGAYHCHIHGGTDHLMTFNNP